MNEISSAIPLPVAGEGNGIMKSKNSMGKDDFMKLLMTQLRHQDPLNPMDGQQFAAQLAQFSQLEQLTNIGTGIQNLRTGMSDGSKLQALEMIGKKVTAAGNETEMRPGGNSILSYTPKADVTPVKATIYDAGGKLVRELDIVRKPGSADEGQVAWDGKDQDGKQLPAGHYSYRIVGVGQNGQGQELNSQLEGKVVGVDVDGKTPTVVVEGIGGKTRLELSKINQVTSEESAPPAAVRPEALQPQAQLAAEPRSAAPIDTVPREAVEGEAPQGEPDLAEAGEAAARESTPFSSVGGVSYARLPMGDEP